jgi:hypothetical protein
MNKFIVLRDNVENHRDFCGDLEKFNNYIKTLNFKMIIFDTDIKHHVFCVDESALSFFILKYPDFIFCLLDTPITFLSNMFVGDIVSLFMKKYNISHDEAVNHREFKDRGFLFAFSGVSNDGGFQNIAVIKNKDNFERFIGEFPQVVVRYLNIVSHE